MYFIFVGFVGLSVPRHKKKHILQIRSFLIEDQKWMYEGFTDKTDKINTYSVLRNIDTYASF